MVGSQGLRKKIVVAFVGVALLCFFGQVNCCYQAKHANMLPTCHQHPPTPQEFAQFAGADGLKKLINCLWALTLEKRPTFRELQAAMAGDKEILQAFPGAFSGIGAS